MSTNTAAPTTEDGPVIEPEHPFHQVKPRKGSRLEQLHAAYADAKATADEATARLKAVTDGIKLELTQAAPEETRIELTSSAGTPLRLTYVESWRLDSKKLKAQDPETYVRYARKSGAWTLKAAAGATGGEG